MLLRPADEAELRWHALMLARSSAAHTLVPPHPRTHTTTAKPKHPRLMVTV